MKCQNCGSKNIVAIQGQHYCIRCGQIIDESKLTTTKIEAPPPKKRSLDITATPAPIVEDVPRPVAATKFSKAPDFKLKPLKDPIEKSQNKSKKLRPQATGHTVQFVSKLALYIAFPIGALLAVALYLKLDADIILYASIALLLMTGLLTMLLQAALFYGGSKSRDGRGIQESKWWAMAWSHFSELINLNLIALAGLIVIVLGGYGFWEMSQQIPTEYQIPLLILANMFISWLAIGLFCLRRLAIAVVAIGGLSVFEAYTIAWNMYQDFGGHLILSAAETLLIRLVAISCAVVTALASLNLAQLYPDYESVIFGTAVFISLFLWLVVFLRFEIKIWLSRYRWIAEQRPSREKSQLLVGPVVA